jgi:peptide/nickel transport system substrate-binding protein
MDIADAPMNYVNGTTEVEGLLVEDFETNDDLTEYTFTMKEGIQFHGDYGEVTADDVVYSIQRLVESGNSTNTYFPNSVLNIEREEEEVTFTDDEGETQTTTQVVPGTTEVEATGDYEFTVTLREPFGYALSVLAYGAFSVVPEGIVGDIEGYDGDMDYGTFAANPISCGPFTLESWEPGNGGNVVRDRFDDYHGDAAAIAGIDSATITDTTASYNYFLNDNADISGVPTEQYNPDSVSVEETLEGGQQVGTYDLEGTTVNYAGVPTIDTFYIGFNMREVPKAVRQAMAYVVNQDQFVESVFKGRGEGAYHLSPKQVFPGGADAYDSHYQG